MPPSIAQDICRWWRNDNTAEYKLHISSFVQPNYSGRSWAVMTFAHYLIDYCGGGYRIKYNGQKMLFEFPHIYNQIFNGLLALAKNDSNGKI